MQIGEAVAKDARRGAVENVSQVLEEHSIARRVSIKCHCSGMLGIDRKQVLHGMSFADKRCWCKNALGVLKEVLIFVHWTGGGVSHDQKLERHIC